MDWPALLAKIVGLVLLGTTIRSVYKHVRTKIAAAREGKNDGQAAGEAALNGILLYAWLVFMLVFSTGMILNN